MNEKYIFLKRYTERLIEKGKCLPGIGLWAGKMGLPFICFILRGLRNTKYMQMKHRC